MKYELSAKAKSDLRAIYRESIRQFGLAQADQYYEGFEAAFAILTTFPHAGTERKELSPPARVFVCGSHLIFYAALDDRVLILAVRHGREDWLPRGR